MVINYLLNGMILQVPPQVWCGIGMFGGSIRCDWILQSLRAFIGFRRCQNTLLSFAVWSMCFGGVQIPNLRRCWMSRVCYVLAPLFLFCTPPPTWSAIAFQTANVKTGGNHVSRWTKWTLHPRRSTSPPRVLLRILEGSKRLHPTWSHPSTWFHQWLASPPSRVVGPLPNGLFLAYKWWLLITY